MFKRPKLLALRAATTEEMSLCAAIRRDDQPRSDRLIRLQNQIGKKYRFGFSFSFNCAVDVPGGFMLHG
ncbi:hypothetical protein RGCCGE502_34361 (plasmid) [Rhizobium grahamii CCGE 502]|uniref:Uncharacterized protein n=1 Tax=Rhizobium grahamii CCGE 502 TaxID=990285 RepID=S3HKF6_9HYPH|nr:hypothetical protein RGCCGE502_34361 [Rhizobium grahamii CCGE 502]